MKPTLHRVIEALSALLAVGTVAFGLWAMTAPRSFYGSVAPFPPYSRHLVHDIGAFQIGLGGCLVVGLFLHDAMLAVLAGNAVAGIAHFLSHVMDRSDGGHVSDPFAIGALALLLLLLTLARGFTTIRLLTPPRADEGNPS